MGLGIIEPKAQHVPGTVRLFDDRIPLAIALGDDALPPTLETHKNLKHGTGKDSETLLVPQPSDSPNDPLNWPLWKRDLTLLILCFAGATGAVVGPAVAPITGVLVDEFETSYTEVAKWSGWQFWASGVAGLLASAVSRVWGKRPVYVVSTALCFAGALWNVFATTPDSFLGARFVQGLGLGAFETIVPSSIGDMFFVHQRGKRMALYNLCFLGATYFMPVLGGYISTKYGWRTQFIIISAFLGPACVLVFLFVPEHMYNRPAIFDTDTASHENLAELSRHLESEKAAAAASEAETEAAEAAAAAAASSTTTATATPPPTKDEKKHSFVRQLRLYNGRFSSESFFRCLLAPFVLFLYPATLWSFLFQGTFITWGIAVSIILAQLFAGPPTNFTPAQLGYMYAAPFLGAVLSYLVAGVFSDRVAKAMARRNAGNVGTYEPEFRILLVAPVALVSLPGVFAFGRAAAAVAARDAHWVAPSVCYGLLTFGVVMSCTATFSYVLDAHRDVAIEMMVSLLLLKNFWAFGSTFFLNSWVARDGAPRMFYVIGGLQGAVCVLSVAMYVCGKLQRDWMARVNLLRRVGLYPKRV